MSIGQLTPPAVTPPGRHDPIPVTMRVLIVEDEPAIADFIQRGLEAEGYEVEVAATASTARTGSRPAAFDLVSSTRCSRAATASRS